MLFKKKTLVILLLYTVIIFTSYRCGNNDEERIKDTAIAFLEAVNKHDYTLMTKLSTPQTKTFIDYAKSISNKLALYKTMEATDLLIEGNLAEVFVEVTDEYGNIAVWTVPLMKTDNIWKVDMPKQSDAEHTHDNLPKLHPVPDSNFSLQNATTK